jgi:hypothetical protein
MYTNLTPSEPDISEADQDVCIAIEKWLRTELNAILDEMMPKVEAWVKRCPERAYHRVYKYYDKSVTTYRPFNAEDCREMLRETIEEAASGSVMSCLHEYEKIMGDWPAKTESHNHATK